MGFAFSRRSIWSGVSMPRSSGVSTVAGETTFTVMPWRATSAASDLAKPSTAALAPA
jgi:hypothetical protein